MVLLQSFCGTPKCTAFRTGDARILSLPSARKQTLHESHSKDCGCAFSRCCHHRSLQRPSVIVRAQEGDEDNEEEDSGRGGRGQRGQRGQGRGRGPPKDDGPQRDSDGFEERVLQIARVCKVVKGGKQVSFRAAVAVGNDDGQVGVGAASAKEVVLAVEKAVRDAKRHVINVPLNRGKTFPHRIEGIAGGARVMLRPASEGTGVIAGGSVRDVMELSGIKNGFGKQLGSGNPLNNARATVDGLLRQRTLEEAALNRDLSIEQMLGTKNPKTDRLKQAKAEAEKEIKAYKQQREDAYQKRIQDDSSSSGQTEKRLDSESKDAVNAINKSISSKKQEVAEQLLKYVTTVKVGS